MKPRDLDYLLTRTELYSDNPNNKFHYQYQKKWNRIIGSLIALILFIAALGSFHPFPVMVLTTLLVICYTLCKEIFCFLKFTTYDILVAIKNWFNGE